MAAHNLPNLGLTGGFVLGEDDWGDEMNVNLLKLSTLVQGGVLGRIDAVPTDPAPAEGDVYILTTDNTIAVFDEAAWTYFAPREGWLIYDRGTDEYLTFDGAAWAVLETGGGGIEDAPADGKRYGRRDGAWDEIPADEVGITDAPIDGTAYSRQDGQWVPAESGGGGIEEAPEDGKQYARQNGNWQEVVPPEQSGTGGKGPHKFWRMLITAAANDANTKRVVFADLRLSDSFGGIQKAVGGTASASATSGGSPENLFDSNPSTQWEHPNIGGARWVQYEFPTAIQIVEAEIRVNGDNSNRFNGPLNGIFQFSDDGVDFFNGFNFATDFYDTVNQNRSLTFQDTTYIPPYDDKVPQGGAAGTVLTKVSATDGDTEFRPLPFLTLTQAQYDALATKDPATYYFIVG